jgi:hypothetical protein
MVEIKFPKIHESVFERIRNGTDSYGPFTLPRDYMVVTATGQVVPGVGTTPGAQETVEQADRRCQRQARLWDMVWRRRTIYFVTLMFTLALIAVPWLFKPTQLDWGGWTQAVSFVPDLLALVLPDFLSGWLDAYRINPFLLLVLLGGGIGLGWHGGRMEMRIRRLMRDMWKEWRDPKAAFQGKLPSGRLNSWRVRWGKLPPRRWIKYGLLPTIVGLFFYYVGLAIGSQLVSRAVESTGFTCENAIEAGEMLPRSPCYPTGHKVVEGHSYIIRVNATPRWQDASVLASPQGLGERNLWTTVLMTAAAPFRRHLTEGWFAVMAKIGPDGLNSSVLSFRPGTQPDTWEADFTANAGGELFLYVNDAVLFGWPERYGNNEGSATVNVIETAKVEIESKAN